MIRSLLPRSAAWLGALLAIGACSATATPPAALPDPAPDTAPAPAQGSETAVLAGGCFWGMQDVFEHVKGVERVWAGYAGGNASSATYEQVSDGGTGHAESVKIVFDPTRVSYGQLLKVYFAVAHDPTELNRQGPDAGTQYRSEIFAISPRQAAIARAYIAQLDAAHAFPDPIVTVVAPLHGFYAAEDYHQDYAQKHPDDPYIVINDAPKVEHLKQAFAALYRADPAQAPVRVSL